MIVYFRLEIIQDFRYRFIGLLKRALEMDIEYGLCTFFQSRNETMVDLTSVEPDSGET
jgi:hypothetical protein